jgi:hypothetical protein
VTTRGWRCFHAWIAAVIIRSRACSARKDVMCPSRIGSASTGAGTGTAPVAAAARQQQRRRQWQQMVQEARARMHRRCGPQHCAWADMHTLVVSFRPCCTSPATLCRQATPCVGHNCGILVCCNRWCIDWPARRVVAQDALLVGCSQPVTGCVVCSVQVLIAGAGPAGGDVAEGAHNAPRVGAPLHRAPLASADVPSRL